MKSFKIAVIPGDGIGPEIIAESIKVLRQIELLHQVKFDLTYGDMGAIAIEKHGIPLPENTLEICKSSDAILFGAIGDPKYDNDPSLKVRPEQGLLQLRKELGLFCNIRPARVYSSLTDQSPLKKEIVENCNITIFRELTGGLYFGQKSRSKDGNSASDTCFYSKDEITRITHLAFQEAKKSKGKLTLVDKANVLETSRLWRKVVTEISMDYPEVKLENMFVDNAAMQLILNPSHFNVILTENLFGDILSDAASVLGGSIGLMPSASLGNEFALFEPIHGSYPQAKGKGIANPVASILSLSMLLEYLGLNLASQQINFAVESTINSRILTSELSNECYSTKDVGNEVINQLIRVNSNKKELNY